MKPPVVILMSLLISAGALARRPALKADPPKECEGCAAWNAAQEPFRVFGNTYYVGVAGLSSVLITSEQGLILLDGGLPQSAPLIDASIRKLGFRTEDVRLIVNSHAHYDHCGGIAALQRAGGAIVAASASGARALNIGAPPADDPQYAFGRANDFPPVKRVKIVVEGETLRVGDLAITAHLTPGHTPGSTTWTWRSCAASRCLQIVYADSLNPISAPGFRFTGDATRPSIEATFRRSISKVGGLPCDILLTVHPSFAGMNDKLKRRREQPGSEPFVDPTACRTYADDATKRFDHRIAEELGHAE